MFASIHEESEAVPESSFRAATRPRGIDCAVVQIREICRRWLDERTTRPIRGSILFVVGVV